MTLSAIDEDFSQVQGRHRRFAKLSTNPVTSTTDYIDRDSGRLQAAMTRPGDLSESAESARVFVLFALFALFTPFELCLVSITRQQSGPPPPPRNSINYSGNVSSEQRRLASPGCYSGATRRPTCRPGASLIPPASIAAPTAGAATRMRCCPSGPGFATGWRGTY